MSRDEQKAQTRLRIVEAAGRGFRRGGFGGVGVDGLAKEAGVTSGAFYGHFGSKAAAFHESVKAALADVEAGLLSHQREHPNDWWARFVDFYLGPKRLCTLENSCGLQSLGADVARADEAARASFEAGLLRIAVLVSEGVAVPGAPRSVDSAFAALAALTGAVTLARAIDNQRTADRIAQATRALLLGS